MAQFEDVPGPFVVDTMENGAARAYAAIPGKKFSPDFFSLFVFRDHGLFWISFFSLVTLGRWMQTGNFCLELGER